MNYWEPWYLGLDAGVSRMPGLVSAQNPRSGAYQAIFEGGHDLHELHALMAPQPFDLTPVSGKLAFAADDLLHDVLASLNSSELAQRRFREIARVAGLVFTGYPGQPKSTRQLQASSGLFFEVFRKYDSGNLLLGQAEHEVLSQELDIGRLEASLARIRKMKVEMVTLAHPSPMSLPLMVERFREQLSTETLAARLARILKEAVA